MTLDVLAGGGGIEAMAAGHPLDALLQAGRDEDVDHVGEVAQHVVGRAPHEHAAARLGGTAYGVALELVETLL